MSTLSRQFDYTIPGGKTFPLVRDRGLEYSVSGYWKVKLMDQMKLALRSRHYSRRTTIIYTHVLRNYKARSWASEMNKARELFLLLVEIDSSREVLERLAELAVLAEEWK